MRYAIYFAPPEESRLNRAAVSWLGRCAFSGNVIAGPASKRLTAAEAAYHTAAARRYGFHATIVAPFTLSPDETEDSLIAALSNYAGQAQGLVIPRLVLKRLDGFFALMPYHQSSELTEFAGDIVGKFNAFGAPLSESEMQRRLASVKTASQRQNLVQWGYPYVFDDFRFHMTLTGRVPDNAAPSVEAAIIDHFGSLIGAPLEIDALALFQEAEPGAPFVIRSFHEVVPQAARKTA